MDRGKLGDVLHEIAGVVGLHHLHDVIDEAVKDEEQPVTTVDSPPPLSPAENTVPTSSTDFLSTEKEGE